MGSRRGYLVFVPVLLLGVGQPAHAQQASAVSVAAAPTDLPLPIAPPPVGKITLEVDARENDLLGVVKELLRGLKTVPSAAAAPVAKEAGNAQAPSAAGGRGGEDDFFTLIQQLELDEVLKGITHLHVITIELPASAAPAANLNTKSDLVAFYERNLQPENHRVLWSDKGGTRILMVASDTPRRNFSVVIQSAKTVTVVRADGYPNVAKLTKHFGVIY